MINKFTEKLICIKNTKGNIYKFSNSKKSLRNGVKDIYFTTIKEGKIKGWNYHKQYHSKLMVIKGKVVFYLKTNLNDKKQYKITLSENKIEFISIPPRIFFSFKGIGKNKNIIINLLSGLHKDNESMKFHMTDNK